MDAQQISTLFQATLDQDPQQRAQAEETLKGVSNQPILSLQHSCFEEWLSRRGGCV